MRRGVPTFVFVAVFAGVLIAAHANAAALGLPTTTPADELNMTHVEHLVHQGINERRQAHGDSNLSYDPRLAAIAQAHSQDMASNHYFAHKSPTNGSLGQRYRKAGYRCHINESNGRYLAGAENIIKLPYNARMRENSGRVTTYTNERQLAAGAVNGWMNSTHHRENLLRPIDRREGIGVAVTQENGTAVVYVTEDFC